jgi:dGTPase
MNDRQLAALWQQRLSTRRFKVKGGEILESQASTAAEGAAGLRTEYHIDHDRVVFSTAFRRLGRKTQVHPLASHDHTHNRLTHSVEVACVGRSLGNRVGAMMAEQGYLPEGITPFDLGMVVQVACLAHDIGNPPFGHTGEDALRAWFRDPRNAHWLAGLSDAERLDVQTFEGNAHGFRMVSRLEMYANEGGMRLTAAALGALIKYPWTVAASPKPGKFNFYQSELAYFEAVAGALGLPRQGERWARHPLSYLMEAADDVCYAILDLEDAVEMGIIDVQEFEQLIHPLAATEAGRVWESPSSRQKCAMLRGMAVGRCVHAIGDAFMKHLRSLTDGTFSDTTNAKDLLAVCQDGAVDRVLSEAKDLARKRVYRHKSKVMTELAAYPCLGSILDVLVPAVHAWVSSNGQVDNRQKTALSLLEVLPRPEDGLYAAYMSVLDYVGAMTDNAAAALAREISGVGIM